MKVLTLTLQTRTQNKAKICHGAVANIVNAFQPFAFFAKTPSQMFHIVSNEPLRFA